MPSFREMLSQVKSDIVEIEPGAADEVFDKALFLDVREADEYAQGALPGAVHLPRGFLELQVEGRVPDKDRKIIVYCAGGTRSALAAQALGQLGYTRRGLDGRRVQQVEGRGPRRGSTPQTLDAAQRNRYQRHLLLPEIGEEGQQRLLQSKVLLLGAGGLGSPAALVPGRGRGGHDRDRRHGRRRLVQPAAPGPPQPGPRR